MQLLLYFAGIKLIHYRTIIGIYYAYKNYMCTEGPLMLDLITSAFMILSSFWVLLILSTLGMKFASMFQGEKPAFIKHYIRFATKLSKNKVYRIVYHGGIAILCMGIPLSIKVNELMKRRS